MKALHLVLCIALLAAAPLSAQDAATPPHAIQAAYDACLQLRTAIGAGSIADLRTANHALKAADTSPFSSLRSLTADAPSLDGHFIFDPTFADSLIAGRNVYHFAQRYADRRTVRGTNSQGKIFTKNAAVAASASAKFTFRSKDHQEIAVVTEPGGMVTLRIHDTTNDTWYNDTRDVKRGQPARLIAFDLPSTTCKLEVEVINCCKKDISFVIIGN